MKCIYYLTSTLESSRKISDDLHRAGIGDWFIHFLSRDDSGLKREKLHSSNYLERLDILRYGLLGAVLGFVCGLIVAVIVAQIRPFGEDVPAVAYYAIVVISTLFGSWEGGLTGIATENKKLSVFHDDLAAGKHLIMIYARKAMEDTVKSAMAACHPEAKLVAVDPLFYNPFAALKRL
jgi:hypothetical protein